MIEMTLEEDLPEEFRGGTLRINSENKQNETSKTTTANIPTSADKVDKDSSAELTSNNNNCHWRNAFIAPLSSIPNKITESIWSTKNKEITPTVNEKSLQPSVNVNEDPNNFFTFRDGVVDRAVKECINQFLNVETEGPVYASFLLTQFFSLRPKSLVLVKYDFIALKRLDYKILSLNDIEGIIIGNLVYPSGSLIPKINGFADGLSNILENCLFKRWSKTERQQLEILNQSRTAREYCTDEKLRNLYNLDLFIDQFCAVINKTKENSIILQHNILLENYIGLGSIIHNRNSLGFFKVRGKFSF
ncbi:hypothetical protein NQ314_002791 [Rhamnusium bicolor]|uniref:Uncharacterized protein n=1 Tax=Rhamnusium bicolor TaxID=1586634 RepID=A0AAV8ZR50_9CUCU|nr:hypothetical protein NQ314_002791 [Rhamnusium bicolor]